jgi:hypothetical protein
LEAATKFLGLPPVRSIETMSSGPPSSIGTESEKEEEKENIPPKKAKFSVDDLIHADI